MLTYNEEEDDDTHFGGGENVLMPAVKKEDQGKSSMMSAMFNLTTTIVGGGTLSLPFALASTGLILGIIIILLVAIFAAVSAHLLVKMSGMSSAPSYKDIAIDAYGVIGAKTVEVVIVLFTWGALAAYLVIMGDSIQPVLTLMVHGFSGQQLCPIDEATGVAKCVWYFDPKFYIAVWMVCVCIPLGMLKKMSALKYTSVGSLTATTYIVLVVVVRSIQFQLTANSHAPAPGIVYFNWDLALFVSFPIMAIAYAFHMNIAPVQMELQNPTPGRVQFACTSAVAVGTVLYIMMGVFGYLNFGDCAASNILKSFTDPRDIPIQIGRIAFLFVVTLAFPLIVYPLRMNLRTLFFRTLKRDNVFHVVSTLLVIVSAYGIAISGVSLGLVFGVLGATCGNFLIYTFPGALYVKLSPERWFAWRKLYAIFAIVFGIVMMGLCLFATFSNMNECIPAPHNSTLHNSTTPYFFYPDL